MKNRRLTGFTLIELLIVIILLALLGSLVGPMSVKQLENLSAFSERQQLLREFELWQYRSVIFDTETHLALKDSNFALSRWPGDKHKNITFKILTFPEQELKIGSNGQITPDTVTWYEAGKKIDHSFNENP